MSAKEGAKTVAARKAGSTRHLRNNSKDDLDILPKRGGGSVIIVRNLEEVRPSQITTENLGDAEALISNALSEWRKKKEEEREQEKEIDTEKNPRERKSLRSVLQTSSPSLTAKKLSGSRIETSPSKEVTHDNNHNQNAQLSPNSRDKSPVLSPVVQKAKQIKLEVSESETSEEQNSIKKPSHFQAENLKSITLPDEEDEKDNHGELSPPLSPTSSPMDRLDARKRKKRSFSLRFSRRNMMNELTSDLKKTPSQTSGATGEDAKTASVQSPAVARLKNMFTRADSSEDMILEQVNERLKKEGVSEVTDRERNWILQALKKEEKKRKIVPKTKSKTGFSLSHTNNITIPSMSPLSPGSGRKSRSSSTKKTSSISKAQLEQEIHLLKLNVEEINTKYQNIVQENEETQQKNKHLKNSNKKLKKTQNNLQQELSELKIKLQLQTATTEERDKVVQQMLEDLSESRKQEATTATQLKKSLNLQGKMETQLMQLRSGRTDLEQARMEFQTDLVNTKKQLDKANQQVKSLKIELERSESARTQLQTKYNADKADLEEAYQYISMLEDSDVQLRTAILLVQKQNRALAGINHNLKAQLTEAQATLAMQQLYLDDEDIALLTADNDDVDATETKKRRASLSVDDPDLLVDTDDDGIPKPPPLDAGPDPTAIHNVLKDIPNYVAQKRQQRQALAAELEEDPKVIADMADVFAKALLMRRTKIVESDEEDDEEEEEDNWEN